MPKKTNNSKPIFKLLGGVCYILSGAAMVKVDVAYDAMSAIDAFLVPVVAGMPFAVLGAILYEKGIGKSK